MRKFTFYVLIFIIALTTVFASNSADQIKDKENTQDCCNCFTGYELELYYDCQLLYLLEDQTALYECEENETFYYDCLYEIAY